MATPGSIPKFRGVKDSWERPGLYLKDIEFWVRLNHANEARLILFRWNLTGAAREWYDTLPDRTVDDWEALKAAFLEEYQDKIIDEDWEKIRILEQAATLRQSATESIDEYIRRADALVRRSLTVGSVIGRNLVKGLQESNWKKQTKFILGTRKEYTYDDAKQSIISAKELFDQGTLDTSDKAVQGPRQAGVIDLRSSLLAQLGSDDRPQAWLSLLPLQHDY